MRPSPPFGVFVAAAFFVGVTLSVAPGQSPTKGPGDQQIAILTTGPVHEAFAQPQESLPQPTPVVPRQPPEPVPELPPDLKPDGANIGWIAGYWAWDAERNDFIWISGTYRDAPPGRQYVPGYWEQTAEGWRWINGFWAPAEQPPALSYLPPPPASMDTGPAVAPPGDDYSYVPGIWINRESRYGWRPGYWAQCRPGLVWIPPAYVWTPAGCVFVSGYWDYPLDRRGLLFAPAWFGSPLWRSPGWAWQPQYVVATDPMLGSLFVDPASGFYRFGNYYGPSFLNRGIQPWYNYGPRKYDALYGYYRWQNRGNAGWQSGMAGLYRQRIGGTLPVPPATLTQQQSLLAANPGHANLRMVVPLANVSHVKLSTVNGAQRATLQKSLAQQQGLSQNRLQAESSLAKTGSSASLKTPGVPQGTTVSPGSALRTTGGQPGFSGTQAGGKGVISADVKSTPTAKTVTAYKSPTPAPVVASTKSPAPSGGTSVVHANTAKVNHPPAPMNHAPAPAHQTVHKPPPPAHTSHTNHGSGSAHHDKHH
jgi:hypothetical protein